MRVAIQPSLLSFEQEASGVAVDGVTFGSLDAVERSHLGCGAWVDVCRGWLRGGFDLFDSLLASPGWRAERRRMYDSVVAVPRLLRFFTLEEHVPWPALVAARQELSRHYNHEIGEDLTTTGLCLYRDGQDSVAWHGDTLGRGATVDTVVAILSLGATRSFALRPRTGGPSRRLTLDHGDLVAMGGTCQRTWEHAVPKTARPVGPRVSIQFRATGVS